MTKSHPWQFFVVGGVRQVRLSTADDLGNLAALDQKLWVALSCPVKGTELDARSMAVFDLDGDGQVRVLELVATVNFVCRNLRQPEEIFLGRSALPLDRIRTDNDESRALLASARALLFGLQKPEAESLAFTDFANLEQVFATMPLTGDGLVHSSAAPDEAVATILAEISAALGPDRDRGGREAISKEKIDTFYDGCAKMHAWFQQPSTHAAILPLGDSTAAAASALSAVKSKVDDWFLRCRLAAFDNRAEAALNRNEADFVSVAAGVLSSNSAEIEAFPLAKVESHAKLSLVSGLNPAWAARIDSFRSNAVIPVIGHQADLTEAEWLQLQARLAPYATWQAEKPSTPMASLAPERIAALVAGTGQTALHKLVAADEAMRPEAEAIVNVERLVRAYAHLGELLNNFVNFSAFYGTENKAIFQAGTVFFDQRSCDLVLSVNAPARHATMAGRSGFYLIYMDCVRRSDGLTRSICAAVTDGDSDDILVGRNGIFYDRQGRDYDAQVTKIVENPLSVRQAFWSPYKKLVRTIETAIEKRAAAAEAESAAGLAAAGEGAVETGAVALPAPKPIDVGTVAALGVGVGGLTAALGAFLSAFLGMGYWLPLGILGLLLAISGPSMLIAAMKLRRRSLGPVLDAEGWALNAQARVNIPLGQSLTQLALIPPGSTVDRSDPFRQRRNTGAYVVVFVLVVAAIAATLYVVATNAGLSLSP